MAGRTGNTPEYGKPQYIDANIEEMWRKPKQIIDVPDEDRFSGEEVEIRWRPDDAMIGRTNTIPEYRYVDEDEILGPQRKIDQIIDIKNVPDKHGSIHKGSERDWRHNDALIRIPDAAPELKYKRVKEILMPYPRQKLPQTGSYQMQVQQPIKGSDINIPGYIGRARFEQATPLTPLSTRSTLSTLSTPLLNGTSTSAISTTQSKNNEDGSETSEDSENGPTTRPTSPTTSPTTTKIVPSIVVHTPNITTASKPTATTAKANKCFYNMNVISVIIVFFIWF